VEGRLKITLVACYNPSRPLLDKELCLFSDMGTTLFNYCYYLVVSANSFLV